MKVFIFFSIIILYISPSFAQRVAINEDGSAPANSALLDLKSSNKGLLIPRMSSTERIGIASPALGLLVFDNQTASFWYYKVAGWTELIAGGAGANSWTTNGADIYNNNNGNVGIGTNTPNTKLTITTDINTPGWTHIGRVNGVDSIVLGEGIGGVSAAIGTITNHALRFTAGPGSGKMSIYPSGDIVVGPNSSGSFGKFTVVTPNNSYGISHISDEGNIFGTYIGGTSAGIGTFSNTNLRIFCNTFSRIFVAAATGNVGIGTDNPTSKLSVVGNIRAYEVVVENNWADYVFEKAYKLPSLSEVEKFIQLNKHLPNIPSAKEIKEKGLSIGDTQKRMMEKIEELTLYMIEANKKIEALELLLKK